MGDLQLLQPLRRRLRKAMYVTGTVIMGSVVLLAVSPLIAAAPPIVGIVALAFAVCGLGWSVWLCWAVIRAALGRD